MAPTILPYHTIDRPLLTTASRRPPPPIRRQITTLAATTGRISLVATSKATIATALTVIGASFAKVQRWLWFKLVTATVLYTLPTIHLIYQRW